MKKLEALYIASQEESLNGCKAQLELINLLLERGDIEKFYSVFAALAHKN